MKKLASLIVAAMLIVSMLICSIPVSAATPEPTIDTTQDGTITLHKYDPTTVVYNATTGLPESGTPVAGAGFTSYQILDYTTDGYKLTDLAKAVIDTVPGLTKDTFINSIVITDSDTEGDDGYINYGSTTDLENIIFAIQKYVNTNNVTGTTKSTDANGVATFDSLALGVYFVAETLIPDGYIASTAPFLVAVPYWKSNTDGWTYSVDAYPKNQAISIDKKVEGADTTSLEIGDTANYTVEGIVPDYGNSYSDTTVKTTQDRTVVTTEAYNLMSYEFVDTFATGLTYKTGSMSVKIGNTTVDADDYTLSASGQTVSVSIPWSVIDETYNGQGLAIKFSYQAVVNKDAVVVGEENITEGNLNEAMVKFPSNPATFPTNASDITEKDYISTSDVAIVYTYKLHIDKTFNGQTYTAAGVTPTQVKFEVADENGDLYSFIETASGKYTLWSADDSNTAPAATTTVLSLGTDSTLDIKGLENKTYYVTETQSADGYAVLAQSLPVKVSDKVEGTKTVTTHRPYYVESVAALTASGKTYYTKTGNTYTEIDAADYDASMVGTVVYYTETKTITATATEVIDANVGDNGEEISTTDGIASITINNSKKQFDLPLTGGLGLIIFTIGGGILMALAIIVFYTIRKKSKANRAA